MILSRVNQAIDEGKPSQPGKDKAMDSETESTSETETIEDNLPSIINQDKINRLSNSLPNLKGKGFQKGISGNPAGRPKGSKNGIRAQLKRLLETKGKQAVIDRLQKDGAIIKNKSASGVIASVLVDGSQEGDKDCIKIVLDQTEAALPRNVKVDATLEITKIERLILDNPEVIEIEG